MQTITFVRKRKLLYKKIYSDDLRETFNFLTVNELDFSSSRRKTVSPIVTAISIRMGMIIPVYGVKSFDATVLQYKIRTI